jgi:hypothetical protein
VSSYTKIPSSNTTLNLASYTNIPSSYTTLNKSSYTNLPSSSAFTPASLSTLEMWLKGDAIAGNDGDAITTWTKSGGTSGVSPTQATGARKPILKTGGNGINGLNVLRFDGSLQYMLGTFNAGSTGMTIFFVGRSGATVSSYSTVVGSGGNASFDNRTTGIYWAFAYGSAVDTFGAGWGGPTGAVGFGNLSPAAAINTSFRFRYKTDKVNWAISGPNNGTPADTSFPTATFQMYLGCEGTTGGGNASSQFKGDIGEIIVCSSALSAGDISSVDAYLLARWGV